MTSRCGYTHLRPGAALPYRASCTSTVGDGCSARSRAPTRSVASWPTAAHARWSPSTTGSRPSTHSPPPFNDCYAALQAVPDIAAGLDIDAKRLAVGGDSAGANIATALALKARDEGGPALVFQLLVYPVTDHSFDTPSYSENADGYLLTRDMMEWFWEHYIGGPADS